MPGRVIVVDDVASGDPGRVPQRQVVVQYGVLDPGDELANAQAARGRPNLLDQRTRVRPRHAVPFLVNIEVLVADHVQQHAPAVLVGEPLPPVVRGEVPRTAKVRVVHAEDELLAVKQREVDAVGRLEIGHVVRQLHQHGHAAAAIVGPDERPARVDRVEHRQRQRIVVGAQQDPLLALGVPLDDEIGHGDLRAVHGVPDVELLELDLATQLAEVLRKQLLLGLHPLRAATPRPDGADLPQVLVRPGAVERDVLQPELGIARLGAAVWSVVHDNRDVADHQAANHHRCDQEDGLAGHLPRRLGGFRPCRLLAAAALCHIDIVTYGRAPVPSQSE